MEVASRYPALHAYDQVIEAAINLIVVDTDMVPSYVSHFKRELHAAC
jgi:hypothetical protein